MRGAVVIAVCALALTGCSGVADQEAGSAAAAFAGAEPAKACELLAPDTLDKLEQSSGKKCEEALAALKLPTGTGVEGVTVAGESAQVKLADQVVFLARFPQGWLVTAAGCEHDDPDSAVPYQCEVES